MGAKSQAYTTDVVFPSAFGVFQSPVHLAYAAWLGERRAFDVRAPFAYADLGCGGGLTLCVLAACYPHGQFHGIDINPEHIAQGRALAADAGLDNVTFHHLSFADLAAAPLPARFDAIAMSGIYSWLSPALRRACLDFASARLSDAGVVFLHYSALPGNAQIDALYALLIELSEGIEGDTVTRFRGACEKASALRAASGLFFRQNPLAAAWLDQIARTDQRQMAHEVLNSHWGSLSIRNVADDAAAVGLHFVANAHFELNDIELAAPAGARDVLAGLRPVAREMALDATRSAIARIDVFMRKSDDKMGGAEPPDLWVDRLTSGPLAAERAQMAQRAGVDLFDPVYEDILSAIDGRARRLGDLLAVPDARDAKARELALKRIIALKLAHLQLEPFPRKAPEHPPRLASRINSLLLTERIEVAGALPLASPVAGTQVLLPPEDRLALLALVNGDFEQAWARIERAGQNVRLGERQIRDARALAEVASARAKALRGPIVDRLFRLGILA
jgi:SAM-dependent methyltransferase